MCARWQIAILRQLDHPHIVALKEVVVTRTDTFIVMELLSGGELFNRIVDVVRAATLLRLLHLHSSARSMHATAGPVSGEECCRFVRANSSFHGVFTLTQHRPPRR